MSDVRALLRSEQRNRRLAHPDLSYTSAGALQCRPCNILIKTESLWELHLQSARHKNASRQATGSEEAVQTGSERKKRKADDESTNFNTVERKKNKPLSEANGKGLERGGGKVIATPVGRSQTALSKTEAEAEKVGTHASNKNVADARGNQSTAAVVKTGEGPAEVAATVDEDQWAAFEKDLASLAEEPANEYSDATIFAPAMTNAEAQARSKEEAALQRTDNHTVEVEGEKEDAARQLEDEFEAMDAYESRVRALRERREALRSLAVNTEEAPVDIVKTSLTVDEGSIPASERSAEVQSDEEEDDAWDEWRIGIRN
ncbi:MAG: hypothetical protein M1814_004738 [Vezdaea aestivalis]|nr:MAG: hypothetical protein M1814_004738 [Vezdaea aestivalis]